MHAEDTRAEHQCGNAGTESAARPGRRFAHAGDLADESFVRHPHEDRQPELREPRQQALDDGMLTLRMDGIVKAAKGITTLEEVIKETSGQ